MNKKKLYVVVVIFRFKNDDLDLYEEKKYDIWRCMMCK